MAQVKKYLKGKELARISELEQQINTLLQDANVSDDLKAQALAIRNLGQEVINSEGFKARDERRYRLGLNDSMLNVLTGKQAYSPSMTGSAISNIFGYYSKPETNWMVNETARIALRDPQESRTQISNGVDITTPIGEPYYWHWDNNKFNPNNVRTDLDSNSKINMFIDALLKGLNDYTSLNRSNQIVHNAPDNAATRFPELITSLNTLKQSADVKSKLDGLSTIVSELQNSDPAIATVYQQFLLTELSPSAEVLAAQQTAQNAAAAKQTLDKLAAYNTYLKIPIDGSTDSYFVLLDPTKNDYLNLIILDQNGNQKSIYNLATDYEQLGQSNPELWKNISEKIRNTLKLKFPIVDYTHVGGKKGIDFSNYFSGNDIIFTDTKNYNPDVDLWIPYTTFFPNWEELKSNFKYSGNADVAANGHDMNNQYFNSLGIQNFESIPTELNLNVKTIFDLFGGNRNKTGEINISGVWDKYNFKDILFPNISSNITPETFINALTYFIAYLVSGEKDQQENYLVDQKFPLAGNDTGDGNKNTYGYYMMKQLLSQPQIYKLLLAYALKLVGPTLSSESKNALIKEYNMIQTLKNGGILSMRLGGTSLIEKQLNNSEDVVAMTDIPMETWNKVTLLPGEKYGLNDTENNTIGLTLSIASAAVDLALMFDPAPYSSAVMSAGVLALNQIADDYLNVPIELRIIDGTVDTIGGVASVVPLFGNATQYLKLARRCSQIGKVLGTIGMPISTIAAIFGIKNIADQGSFEKLFTEGPSALSKEELHNLVRTMVNSVGVTRSLQAITRSNKNISDAIKEPTFILAKKDGKSLYVPIDKTKVDAATSAKNEALSNLKFWNLNKKRAANKAYVEAITPEGYTPITNRKGMANTDINYVVDPMKANKREGFILGHPYWSKFLASPSSMKPYDPNTNFSNIVSNWWNNLDFHLLSFMKTYPVSKTPVKIGDTNIDIIGIPKSYSDRALKQFNMNVEKVKVEDIPAEIKSVVGTNEVFFDPVSGKYIYTISSLKNGGKLDRLTNYINNNYA